MADNTVVTLTTERYIWGTYLLIASMRKNGMQEPVLVGARRLPAEMQDALKALGQIKFFSLDNVTYSVSCYKPLLMLQVKTPYVTWVSSDGFFTGNASSRLIPLLPDQIHCRMRGPEENPLVFRGFIHSGEDGSTIPEAVLNVWRDDVAGLTKPLITRSCSSSVISLHESARDFLRKWHYQMMAVLPTGEVDGADPSVRFYHLLSESVFNSVLAFSPQAPRVSPAFALDKDPNCSYIHFEGRPKPWHGWTSRTFSHFDAYLDLVDWVREKKLPLPSSLPFCLKRRNRLLCAMGKGLVALASCCKRSFRE